ncbi:uridine kinase [soil metagenome]
MPNLKPSRAPYIIGVAGGSGSGKTYFAEALRNQLGGKFCEILLQDSFYIDQSSRFDFDGGSVNFDHPDAIDFSLLAERIRGLKALGVVEIPIYDFVTHSRRDETVRVQPKPVIIVDGILIFHSKEVRELFDEMIFFDTNETLRYQRRLSRDVHERGRTPEGVQNQFLKQVKPMHDAFVEPSKAFAQTTVCDVGEFDGVLKSYFEKLNLICRL